MRDMTYFINFSCLPIHVIASSQTLSPRADSQFSRDVSQHSLFHKKRHDNCLQVMINVLDITFKLRVIVMKKLPLSILPMLLVVAFLSQAAEEGQSPPQCSATMADAGKTLDLSAYKGKVVLIDFWATWCPPCKKSMPFLNGLRNERMKEGFEIIAINVDEDSEEAKRFLTSNLVDYPMAFDPKGDCPAKYGVMAMPSSYLIDKTGKIRKIHLGFRDEDQAMLRDHVSALLAE